jgi:hypothetical protein
MTLFMNFCYPMPVGLSMADYRHPQFSVNSSQETAGRRRFQRELLFVKQTT